MKIISLILILFLFNLSVFAQRVTGYSRSEFGFMVGQSYYLGDLNPFKQFENRHMAGGVIFRYNVNPRLALRFNGFYGKVSAADSNSTRDVIKNRNLSFESNIFEFAGGLEFNYFPFQVGHPRYKGSAYLLAQIGFFQMNPKSSYNGQNDIALQPLGTEGQNSNITGKNKYSLTQLCIPLGVGARLTFWKIGTLNLEFGIRKTFTDYLDDVHSDTYVDKAKLIEQSGPLSGVMSNRSLDGNQYGKRGNSATKDWYVFYGGMITFKLGRHSSCPSAL